MGKPESNKDFLSTLKQMYSGTRKWGSIYISFKRGKLVANQIQCLRRHSRTNDHQRKSGSKLVNKLVKTTRVSPCSLELRQTRRRCRLSSIRTISLGSIEDSEMFRKQTWNQRSRASLARETRRPSQNVEKTWMTRLSLRRTERNVGKRWRKRESGSLESWGRNRRSTMRFWCLKRVETSFSTPKKLVGCSI